MSTPESGPKATPPPAQVQAQSTTDSAESRPEPRPVDKSGRHLVLMLTLTFSTGIIDALGYLGLDRVFTANMTGNVVILGMGLMGADGLPVLGPLLALCGFLLGAGATGGWLRHIPRGWGHRSTLLLLLVGGGAVGIGVALLLWREPDPAFLHTVTGGLGLIMGAQAATARKIAVADVTTVVITSTITGLAADARWVGGSGQRNPRRIAAVVLMLAGAAAGAGLLMWLSLGAGLVVAGSIVAICAVAGHLRGRDA